MRHLWRGIGAPSTCGGGQDASLSAARTARKTETSVSQAFIWEQRSIATVLHACSQERRVIYHFNLHDGPELSGSDEVELPNIQTARSEAVRFIASILIDAPDHFWASDEWTLDVTDARGLVLFSLCVLANESPAIKG